MIKVTRIITYYYDTEDTMKDDMIYWSVKNGMIIRSAPKTILSETSEPITLPTFNL